MTDDQKVNSIFDAIGCQDAVQGYVHKRLGKPHDEQSPRPLLITMSKDDAVKEVLRAPKPAGPEFSNIRLKKDTHPAFRKEWGCLYHAEESEKKKAENQGRTVVFDKKKRQILVDREVVDCWKLDFQ